VKLTDEAVEAAAKAHHHELYPWVLWENLKPESREYYRDEVRAPLAAALPHLEGATPAIDREMLAAAAHKHYCVTPNEPTHEPDEIDYDKADEILEILALIGGAS
jgi:hypothetical protein